jgi:hypothetical protein
MLFAERQKHEEELLKLRNDLEKNNKSFVEREKLNLYMAANEELDLFKLKYKRKKEKIREIKNMRNSLELKMVFFKWKMSAMAMRNIEAACQHNFGTES